MRSSKSPKKESRDENPKTSEEFLYLGDNQANCSALKGEDIQDPAIHPWELNKLHIPKPPKGQKPQKPALMASVHKIQPADEVRTAVAHPVNLDPDSQPLDYTGLPGLQFDDQGMLLPHCILGSLEDFRRCLEAKGETELVKRIPKPQIYSPSEAPERHHSEAAKSSSAHRNIQTNALQNWDTHMMLRRQQQDFLSDLLDRPVENLMMNHGDHFRETQEQREFLNQVMPLIHSGYGHRVGSEFWSLPQRYGDEMSGITATLTQTEQGRREPVTHVGQPSSIRQESGIICAETLRPATWTWDQSTYLQRRRQELGEVLPDMDIRKPDIDGLVMIGSSKPFSFVTTSCGPLPMKEEEETEDEMTKNDILDPLAPWDDVRPDPLLIPALRFCGQLAKWIGRSINQAEVGISPTIYFEAMAGKTASSTLELHNEGSTPIFYSWEQVHVPQYFAPVETRKKPKGIFQFNSSSGMMRPGGSHQVEFIFKPKGQGINTEIWHLVTHPVLLQGASVQVRLQGVGLDKDRTAAQREALERDLEERVTIGMSREIVDEIIRGVGSPERPTSPAELYVTEKQEFLSKNPKLQYVHQSVEDLKILWQEVKPEHIWDLSVNTFRQAVLSLPRQARESSLTQLNFLLLQLSEPPQLKQHQLTAEFVGSQLWGKLLDTMADEAMELRNQLDLPERDTWVDTEDEASGSDDEMADNTEEKSETKGGAPPKERRSGARSRFKDNNKGESKSVEDSRKKWRRKEEVGERTKAETSPGSSVNQQLLDDQRAAELEEIYTRLLHDKVYALVEDLVDDLCAMMDELKEGDTQTPIINL